MDEEVRLFSSKQTYLLNLSPQAEAPAPAEPEKPWSEEAPEVNHATAATFEPLLASTKHVLVMFYAPCESFWC